jgi:polyphenol oxidase
VHATGVLGGGPLLRTGGGSCYRGAVADVLRSDLLRREGFAHGFSLRTGGVSRAPFDTLNLARSVGDAPADVAENHRRFAAAVGFDPDRLMEVSQVHGAGVWVVEPGVSPAQTRREEADALVALGEGVAVAVRVADCVPVLMADRRSGAVAAVHAGWRGCVAGVVVEALRELEEEAGTAASDLVVAIGPHIRVGAFEVGDEVAAHLDAAAPRAEVVVRGKGKPRVDLAGVVRAQLIMLGVPGEQVEDVGGCTHDEPERFFSYRRDGRSSGRHLGVIVPRPG